jgi:uncharacterized peroxidase-related enzyme
MAWITTVAEKEAQGELKEIYDRLGASHGHSGYVANIMKAFSLKPAVLAAVSGAFQAVTFGASNLSRTQEEMIATVVSSLNRCHYWTNAHAEFLRVSSNGDDDLVNRLKRDWRSAAITVNARVMLAYVEKLTLNSQAITKTDLDELRCAFSEKQVYDIVIITAIFNFIDRVASAFGVELDAGLQQAVDAAPDQEAFPELAARCRRWVEPIGLSKENDQISRRKVHDQCGSKANLGHRPVS